MEKNFYITTTLPYVNADLHMGHALEFIRADIIARSKKLQGFDVFFNTGTDEHGSKIYETAKSLGKDPQAYVDEQFERFKESVKIFGMDNDILHFVRTTNKDHIARAQEFWKRCYNNGFIYKKNYEAKYCVGCEETKTDSELVDGKCELHPNREIEIINEENYFFKYSAFQEKLLSFYEKNSDFVIPDFRFNEIKAFVERGLHDFSISRQKEKVSWGIPVPGDDSQVMYVWFDALVNYISTLGWPDGENFEKYWKKGTPIQYCGKDNLRFQSAMWQAMLMAAGVENSKKIVINGFITGDGGVKMSKSLGNTVDPKDIVSDFGTDALRFFLSKEISNFEDSPFTMERFKSAYNAGLANGIGNLTSRIMKMAKDNLSEPVSVLLDDKNISKFNSALDAFEISKAVDFIWSEISDMDKFIQENQPFKVVKTDSESGKKMITDLVQRLFVVSHMLSPVMPETSRKIKELIKTNETPEQPLFIRKD